MLWPAVMPVTLMYAEKVKYIAFTFPKSHPAFFRAPVAPQVGYSSHVLRPGPVAA
ncbi:hypothetical protein QE394_001353 [Arthrobacter sp. SORGH_AS 212]|nr:hypothetical protein [Arthrobacter sp. SORGH_AS_0212]